MNRFTQRIERDLGQIADRATPSSTAWEAIQHRIDEQDTTNESTMEVIMLSPDRNEPPTRSRTWMLVAASVAAVALVGGLLVIANRDTDDNVPADQPVVTVPDTSAADGETAPAPDAEQSDAETPAPDAVDPEVAPVPEGPIDPAAEQATETLPPVELPTQGMLNSICTTTNFTSNDDGSITGPQNCVNEADVLPISADVSATLTIFSPDTSPTLFVSTEASGALNAGYTTSDGAVRYSGITPGVGDFNGETIYILGRRPVGGESRPGISDWTTEPGDGPLPTTEEGGISAEVTITCSAEFIEGDDTSQVLEQSCSYGGDDARFVSEPQVITTRLFTADPEATLGELDTPLFVTGTSESGYVMAGIAADASPIVRALGVRPGTGEFDGLLVHDVLYLVVDDAFNITGTIRSTVYGAE